MASQDGVAAAANAALSAAVTNEDAYQDVGVGEVDMMQIQQRYGEERAKRLREDGMAQFIDLSLSDKYKHFQDDPWVDPKNPVKDVRELVPDGCCKLLVVGAGYGGLMFAVHMVQAGYKPSDIRIVDNAAGFGGTWYWSRYPGLMCDTESYIYMPLLEETGHMPKHRYAYGPELREHAERIATHWELHDSAVFQSHVTSMTWSEEAKEWSVEVTQTRTGEQPQTAIFRSQFVAPASGVLNFPQLPGLAGIEAFKGGAFHTSRWNYEVTGGSPEDPSLTKLRDKTVAIIGTGATAVQAVPQLARWAKQLYVFQRTPASVDERGQRETDAAWFAREVARGKDWQYARNRNFMAQVTVGERPAENMVDDSWSRVHSYCALVGGPDAPMDPQQLPAYAAKLHGTDMTRQARVRARTKNIVKDSAVAESLVSWYPSWCKRPCFHDDYLPTFNQPNVTLVDTDGRGVDSISAEGIVFNGKTYPVDVLIFSTGFRSPYWGSPAERANTRIFGRDGIEISDAWQRDGPATLHGVIVRGFPNLLLPGPTQATGNPNQAFALNVLTQHGVRMVAAADRRAEGRPFALEPTQAAIEDWKNQLLARAGAFLGMSNCTPSYINGEGDIDRMPLEEQMKRAGSTIWGHGMGSFIDTIHAWRAKDELGGLEVRT